MWNNLLRRLACLIFGHQWVIIVQGRKKKRICGRCKLSQVWTILFKPKDVFEGWL
jgi:hypothetical protein